MPSPQSRRARCGQDLAYKFAIMADMAIENTVLITAVAVAFGSLWLFDRFLASRNEACANRSPRRRRATRPTLRFDSRTGLYMPDVPKRD